ncbi:MAG: hypothetical protein P1P76_07445 [Anaerolineales bacterium]|nr:hypothetical protein [Anaerolineales bacterium]
MKDSMKMLKGLLQKIIHTHEDELDCQQVYEVLDVYAEMSARGEDVSAALPMVKHHLEMCKDCEEEFEALMRVLEESHTP